MSYADPRWLEGRRKYWTRPDGYRFFKPGCPEAKMPGWLDPWATRVRMEEAAQDEARAQAEAAQEEFERDLLQLRLEVKKLKLEHELWCFEQKYSPDQPRVPPGSPQGGQWTSGGSGTIAPQDNASALGNQPSSPMDSTSAGESENDSGVKPLLVQMGGDVRPVYDKADSALLSPKGVDASASQQTLRYSFDDNGRYLGGVTVVNEDRTLVGRMIESVNRSPVNVRFDAQIQTADGLFTNSFEIRKELAPGSSVTIPWKDFGTMKGPGQVEITATNLGSLYTGVIVGARLVH